MHPSALDSEWPLKLGPHFLSPSLTHPSYLPCLLTGVPSNGRNWCDSQAGEILSMAAWLQLAILSGFPHATVHRATHVAIVGGLSTSKHDFAPTERFMYFILPHLPTRPCCILLLYLRWLQCHACLLGDQCSSWALPSHLQPDGV